MEVKSMGSTHIPTSFGLEKGEAGGGGFGGGGSGGMRRYREEHQWRRRPTGHQLTLRLESMGSKQD